MTKAATARLKVKKASASKEESQLNVGKVHRVIYYVSDWNRALKFYTETLGLKLKSPAEEGWAAFETNGMEFNLHGGRKTPIQEDEPSVGFRVNNFDATYAALKERGVKMGDITSPCGELRCACFQDSEGNYLSIEGE